MEHNMNFVVFDLETGGFSPEKNPIVEVALQVMNYDLEDIGEYNTIIAPYGDLEITQGALVANGLTMEQIRAGKDSKIVVEELIAFLKPFSKGRIKACLCGHNSDKFDIPFLDEFFRFHKRDLSTLVEGGFSIDTMWWSRTLWKESVNYQLATCCMNAGVELVKAHRAVNDTRATKELVKFFIRNLRGQGNGEIRQEKKFREGFQF